MQRLAAHDIERLKRSAAMLQPSQAIPVNARDVVVLLDELLELRQLVSRLGADITTAAKIARGQC